MFISIHTPKTAGTAIGDMLDRATGRRVVFDYDDYSSPETADPAISQASEQVESFFSAIHGHFFEQKYRGLFTNEVFLTCVRHPIDRIVSQFKHEVYDAISGSQSWRSADLASGRMDIVDFVKSDDNIRCAQSVHVGKGGLEVFDFIFITERIDEDCARFRDKFASDFKAPDQLFVSLVNSSSGKRFLDTETRMKFNSLTSISDSQRSDLFLAMPEDIALYEKAKSMIDTPPTTYKTSTPIRRMSKRRKSRLSSS